MGEDLDLNHQHWTKSGTVYFIGCNVCGAQGPWLYFDTYVTNEEKKKQCAKKWNDRT